MWWFTFREAQFLCSRLKWKPQLNVFVPTYLPPRDSSPPGPPRFLHLAQGPLQGTAAHLSSWGPLSCLAGKFRANKQMKLSGLTNRPFCWTAKHGAPIKSWKRPFFFRQGGEPGWADSGLLAFGLFEEQMSIWRCVESICKGRLCSFPSDGRWARQRDIPQTVAEKSRALNG